MVSFRNLTCKTTCRNDNSPISFGIWSSHINTRCDAACGNGPPPTIAIKLQRKSISTCPIPPRRHRSTLNEYDGCKLWTLNPVVVPIAKQPPSWLKEHVNNCDCDCCDCCCSDSDCNEDEGACCAVSCLLLLLLLPLLSYFPSLSSAPGAGAPAEGEAAVVGLSPIGDIIVDDRVWRLDSCGFDDDDDAVATLNERTRVTYLCHLPLLCVSNTGVSFVISISLCVLSFLSFVCPGFSFWFLDGWITFAFEERKSGLSYMVCSWWYVFTRHRSIIDNYFTRSVLFVCLCVCIWVTSGKREKELEGGGRNVGSFTGHSKKSKSPLTVKKGICHEATKRIGKKEERKRWVEGVCVGLLSNYPRT